MSILINLLVFLSTSSATYFIWFFVIVVLLFAIIGSFESSGSSETYQPPKSPPISGSTTSTKKVANTTSAYSKSNQVDKNQAGRVTIEDLTKLMGELGAREPWLIQNLHFTVTSDMELKATETVIEQAKLFATDLTKDTYRLGNEGLSMAAEPEF